MVVLPGLLIALAREALGARTAVTVPDVFRQGRAAVPLGTARGGDGHGSSLVDASASDAWGLPNALTGMMALAPSQQGSSPLPRSSHRPITALSALPSELPPLPGAASIWVDRQSPMGSYREQEQHLRRENERLLRQAEAFGAPLDMEMPTTFLSDASWDVQLPRDTRQPFQNVFRELTGRLDDATKKLQLPKELPWADMFRASSSKHTAEHAPRLPGPTEAQRRFREAQKMMTESFREMGREAHAREMAKRIPRLPREPTEAERRFAEAQKVMTDTFREMARESHMKAMAKRIPHLPADPAESERRFAEAQQMMADEAERSFGEAQRMMADAVRGMTGQEKFGVSKARQRGFPRLPAEPTEAEARFEVAQQMMAEAFREVTDDAMNTKLPMDMPQTVKDVVRKVAVRLDGTSTEKVVARLDPEQNGLDQRRVGFDGAPSKRDTSRAADDVFTVLSSRLDGAAKQLSMDMPQAGNDVFRGVFGHWGGASTEVGLTREPSEAETRFRMAQQKFAEKQAIWGKARGRAVQTQVEEAEGKGDVRKDDEPTMPEIPSGSDADQRTSQSSATEAKKVETKQAAPAPRESNEKPSSDAEQATARTPLNEVGKDEATKDVPNPPPAGKEAQGDAPAPARPEEQQPSPGKDTPAENADEAETEAPARAKLEERPLPAAEKPAEKAPEGEAKETSKQDGPAPSDGKLGSDAEKSTVKELGVEARKDEAKEVGPAVKKLEEQLVPAPEKPAEKAQVVEAKEASKQDGPAHSEGKAGSDAEKATVNELGIEARKAEAKEVGPAVKKLEEQPAPVAEKPAEKAHVFEAKEASKQDGAAHSEGKPGSDAEKSTVKELSVEATKAETKEAEPAAKQLEEQHAPAAEKPVEQARVVEAKAAPKQDGPAHAGGKHGSDGEKVGVKTGAETNKDEAQEAGPAVRNFEEKSATAAEKPVETAPVREAKETSKQDGPANSEGKPSSDADKLAAKAAAEERKAEEHPDLPAVAKTEEQRGPGAEKPAAEAPVGGTKETARQDGPARSEAKPASGAEKLKEEALGAEAKRAVEQKEQSGAAAEKPAEKAPQMEAKVAAVREEAESQTDVERLMVKLLGAEGEKEEGRTGDEAS